MRGVLLLLLEIVIHLLDHACFERKSRPWVLRARRACVDLYQRLRSRTGSSMDLPPGSLGPSVAPSGRPMSQWQHHRKVRRKKRRRRLEAATLAAAGAAEKFVQWAKVTELGQVAREGEIGQVWGTGGGLE
jgi:hypothetical protein